MAEEFFSLIVRQARGKRLLSDEHFTVDGTLIEAWAGQKSFQRKDQDHDPLNPPPRRIRGSNPTIDFRKQRRKNDTHESSTDPQARLYPVDIPRHTATAAHSESPTLGREVIGLGAASNDYE